MDIIKLPICGLFYFYHSVHRIRMKSDADIAIFSLPLQKKQRSPR